MTLEAPRTMAIARVAICMYLRRRIHHRCRFDCWFALCVISRERECRIGSMLHDVHWIGSAPRHARVLSLRCQSAWPPASARPCVCWLQAFKLFCAAAKLRQGRSHVSRRGGTTPSGRRSTRPGTQESDYSHRSLSSSLPALKKKKNVKRTKQRENSATCENPNVDSLIKQIGSEKA